MYCTVHLNLLTSFLSVLYVNYKIHRYNVLFFLVFRFFLHLGNTLFSSKKNESETGFSLFYLFSCDHTTKDVSKNQCLLLAGILFEVELAKIDTKQLVSNSRSLKRVNQKRDKQQVLSNNNVIKLM